MAFVNSHVLRWKNFYFLYLILLLPIYTEHRNNSRKLCLTPTELLLLADWMHSSYCNDTGVLLKRLGLMKHIPSEMLNLLYHVHLYTTANYVLPNEPSGKQNHWKNEIFAYSVSCCRHHFHLLLLTQLVFFSFSWYTWNCVFSFVQPLVFLLLQNYVGCWPRYPK